MPLITGPPGSGLTRRVLTEVHAALGAGRSDLRLLVPTATMAEHLRNETARQGFVFRPALIGTLSRFVAAMVEDLPPVSPSMQDFLLDRVLERVPVAPFREVRDLPGFRASLARLVDELDAAGCDSRRFSSALPDYPSAAAFHSVFAEFENELQRRGLNLRARRLRAAAERIRKQGLPGVRDVFFDGFFAFTPPELEVIDALSGHAELTVTLPSWTGSEPSRAALAAIGMAEQPVERHRPTPEASVLGAETQDQELEEVARRILQEAAAGRPFREMGVIVRGSGPYVPALEAALERFSIPARFYFAAPLSDHPVARYLEGAVESMLGGWDHEQTLALLRMTASGVGGSSFLDRFDFNVRDRLPGRGLDGLRETAGPRMGKLFDSLAAIDSWRGASATPPEWSARLKTLPALFSPERPSDQTGHASASVWRGHASALAAFESAIDEAAGAFDSARPLPFSEIWRRLKTALRLTELRVPDRRRNVVHVMDAYEARQWELPVVFICGLLEKQFPRYHSQDPLLPDNARKTLRDAGVRLRTAAERDEEERFLFELAVSSATSALFLSYPRFNEKGDDNLPSFLLEEYARSLSLNKETRMPAVRPRPSRTPPPLARPAIHSTDLLECLRGRHATVTPTSLESYLQCPFQFFAGNTLRLKSAPVPPRDRLDAPVQGGILHQVLAQWAPSGDPLEPLFDRIFQETCEERRIPPGYRTEAVRLELLRNLRNFIRAGYPRPAEVPLTEQAFELDLDDGLRLRGRIDRIDRLPDGRTLVIDYKYSARERLRKLIQAHDEGRKVQGGLYMLAASEALGYRLAGMLYAGMRDDVTWEGWHIMLAGYERIGKAVMPDELHEIIEKSRAAALAAVARLRGGRIEVSPADPAQCQYCDFRDVCRVESAAKAAVAGELEPWS